jgi:pectate lyase
MFKSRLVFFCVGFLAACNGGGSVTSVTSDASAPSGTGGMDGTGGAIRTGGATASGGMTGLGGATVGSGGLATSGGTSSVLGSGGSFGGSPQVSTGGQGGAGKVASSGGALPGTGGSVLGSGGAPSSGGAVGGKKAGSGGAGSGGAAPSGGTSLASGGATGTGSGGKVPTGGAPGSGGMTASGGTTGAAGSTGSGTMAGITCTAQTWDTAPIGWATLGGGTTGGGNATPTVASSLGALNSAAGGTNAAVIHVSGKISGIVTVGSNKTILGMCGAEIDGSVDLTGSSNVIMRNLKIVGYNCTDSPSDCSGGHDAVHVQDGDHHLWFDHLDISDGSDGNLDISHACDFITISWTKFHYSGRTDPANQYGHQFCNLIGHSDSNGSEDTGHLNVTFHHVWWADKVEERMPRVRFGKVHVFNSLYTATGNQYGIEGGVSCNIRSENNVFVGTNNPIDLSHTDSASVVQSIGDVFSGTSGSKSGVGGNAFAPTYPYTLESTSTVQASVQSGAGPK